MGVDAYAMLDEQLGHGQIKAFVPTVNKEEDAAFGYMKKGESTAVRATKEAAKGASAAPSAPAPPAAPAAPTAKKAPVDDFQRKRDKEKILSLAEAGLNSRFSNMYKAFQYVDLDRSGRLSRSEIKKALDLWNVPVDDYQLDLLFEKCDEDDDGGISYEEFVDALARGTVAPAAKGKRGMQSKEAMGVDAYAMLDEQLGHGQIKAFVPTVNKEEDAAFGYMKKI
jgi:hypothetical protein